MFKRTATALCTLFAVSVARASDLVTTFHFNPTLSREANPLVGLLGNDPGTMIFTNILGVVLLLFIPLYFYWRYPAKPLGQTPAGLREYTSLQLYNRVLPPSKFLCAMTLGSPMPKDWIQAARAFGIVVSWTVVFGSLLATFSWWAVSGWRWEGYRQIRAMFSIGGYPTMEILCWGIFYYLMGIFYFRAEYNALRRAERHA